VVLAQSGTDSINRTDSDGKRQGKWIVTNQVAKPSQNGYADKQAIEQGVYLDGRKTGVWKGWYPNGNLKFEITFENGKQSGKASLYYESGKVSEEGIWENSRWVGAYKMYYDNGVLQHDFNFNQSGKREGPQRYFASNGQKIIEGEMKNGQETGLWNEWYDDGQKKSELAFVGGTLDSIHTRKFEPQKPVSEVVKNLPDPDVKDKPNTTVDQNEFVISSNQAKTSKFIGEGHYTLYRMDKQISKVGDFHQYRLISGKVYCYSKDGLLQRIAIYQNSIYKGDAPLPSE